MAAQAAVPETVVVAVVRADQEAVRAVWVAVAPAAVEQTEPEAVEQMEPEAGVMVMVWQERVVEPVVPAAAAVVVGATVVVAAAEAARAKRAT